MRSPSLLLLKARIVARQRLGKHIPTATNTHVERVCFCEVLSYQIEVREPSSVRGPKWPSVQPTYHGREKQNIWWYEKWQGKPKYWEKSDLVLNSGRHGGVMSVRHGKKKAHETNFFDHPVVR
jgi:hypothetical protein